MNRPFLKNAVGWFLKDNPELGSLDRDKMITESYNHLVGFMEALKAQDSVIYEYVCQYDPGQSHRLAYFLLDEFYLENHPTIFESNFMDSEYMEETIMGATLGIMAIVGLLNALLLSNFGGRAVSKLFELVGDLSKWVDGLIQHWGAVGRVMRSVLYERMERCSAQCGVETKLPAMATLAYATPFATRKTDEQIQCLGNCYIDHLINVIVMLVNAYQNCIVKTGEIAPKLTDISMIMATHPVGGSCGDIYKKIKSYVGALDEACDRLTDNPRKSAEAYKDLNTKLAMAAKVNVLSAMKSDPSFDRNKKFSRDKFTKPSYGKK